MIGGNVIAQIQIKSAVENAIGEQVEVYQDIKRIKGYLDLISGEASYKTFNAKIQESTHVFISDYTQLPSSISSTSSRLVIGSDVYFVTLIDNPMGLCEHLEFYLKRQEG